MAPSTHIALFAVTQSTRDIDAQVEFYKSIGFVVDDGYDALEDIPDEFYTARGIQESDLKKTICLRQTADPYMHLIINSWHNLLTEPCWPAKFNQVGSRGMTILVGDVTAELSRLESEFPKTNVLQKPIQIKRKWGVTTSALVLDPEGLFLELISIEPGSAYDPAKIKAPHPDDTNWLHFMYISVNYAETSPFYLSFNMSHDHGVDFRPGVGFHPFGFDYFAKQMLDAFGYNMNKKNDGDQSTTDDKGGQTSIQFMRSESDCSPMHLELLRFSEKFVQPPGPVPTWAQNGIARYCFKTSDYAGSLAKQKARGTKIYIEDQRGCLNWGDTQWFFCADTDGNLVTMEEWFPHRKWGERS